MAAIGRTPHGLARRKYPRAEDFGQAHFVISSSSAGRHGARKGGQSDEDKFFNDAGVLRRRLRSAFRAPLRRDRDIYARAAIRLDLKDVDIGVCGVPFDGGATNRAGARHGPRAVRDLSSLMRATHHVFRINPFTLCRIADVGDARFNSLFDNAAAEADLVAFF